MTTPDPTRAAMQMAPTDGCKHGIIGACTRCGEERERAEGRAAMQENHRLRMLLCEVLKALGNGSGASPECSLDFLASIPEEVRLEVAALRASLSLPAEGAEPCAVCGGTERSHAGYLLCECPAASLRPAATPHPPQGRGAFDDGEAWEQLARDILANPRPIEEIKRDIADLRERIYRAAGLRGAEVTHLEDCHGTVCGVAACPHGVPNNGPCEQCLAGYSVGGDDGR